MNTNELIKTALMIPKARTVEKMQSKKVAQRAKKLRGDMVTFINHKDTISVYILVF